MARGPSCISRQGGLNAAHGGFLDGLPREHQSGQPPPSGAQGADAPAPPRDQGRREHNGPHIGRSCALGRNARADQPPLLPLTPETDAKRHAARTPT